MVKPAGDCVFNDWRAVFVAALLAVGACSSSSGGADAGSGGATGSGGSTGTGGATGSGGSAGAGGSTGSGGTTPVDAGSGGSPGDGGGSGGASVDAAPDVATPRALCPPPPYEAMPRAGTPRVVCMGVPRYNWNEGPTWVAAQNAFFFSNFPIGTATNGDMIKYTPSTGTCEIYIQGTRCNGMAVSNDGNILATCQGPRAVVKYDLGTKMPTTVAGMAEGKMLDSPNDIIQHSNGTIYFSNPIFELAGRPVGLGSALLRIDPMGAITVLARGDVNGVALSPDEKRLYAVHQGVWDLDVQGVPSNKRDFNGLGGDGIAVDCAGNIYDNGGNITNPAGQRIAGFPGGTNMAFGGPDGKLLLVVADQNARVVDMNIPGLP